MTTEEYDEIEVLAVKWTESVKKTRALRDKLEALGIDGIEVTPEGTKWWVTHLVVRS